MTANTVSRPRPTRYSAIAKWLHWSIAVSVIVLLPLGPVMKRLTPEGPLRDRLYEFHQSLGALVLLLMIARLARRLAFGVPAPEATLSPLDRLASLAAQLVLYVLLFVTTLLGWAGTNAYGVPLDLFGLFTFPTILGKDVPLSDQIFYLHLLVGLLIAAIVVLHICGALFHRLIKHDGVLARMWPGA